MNRYGIPKQDSVELKDNVNNSSSGDNSKTDIHYYKKIKPSEIIKIGDTYLYVLINKIKDGVSHSISNFPNLGADNTLANVYEFVDMISIDWEDKMFLKEIGELKHKDFLALLNTSISDFLEMNSLEEITEEEFYNLD